jgi:hypothetical protein
MLDIFTIKSIERLHNSRNGNPKYKFVLYDDEIASEIDMVTPTDAGWVYGIDTRALIGSTVIIDYRLIRNNYQIEGIQND